MRRAALPAFCVALAILGTSPAAACSSCGDPDLTGSVPSIPTGPILSEDDIQQGFYIVTKGWTGDTVIVSGSLTTFGFTTTDVANPTTIAKDVAVVATGQRSVADGTSQNTRAVLSDGRLVAGTYVDTYTVDANGNKTFLVRTFLPDDSELKKDAARAPVSVAPAEIAAPAPEPAPQSAPETAPVTPPPSSEIVTPEVIPPDALGVEAPVPVERDLPPLAREDEIRVAPAGPVTPSLPAPTPPPSSPSPAARDVRAGVALGPQADVLTRIEVLRGRRIPLWIRATVDGSPARVLAWSLVAGDVVALSAIAGTGDQPFAAQWPHMVRASDVFVVTFDVLVELTGTAPRRVPASIDVAVRSPALVE